MFAAVWLAVLGVVVGDAMAQTEVTAQHQIPNISAGPNCLVGLKSDGTVIADPGAKELGVDDKNIAEWKDIVQIAAGWHHLVALKKDGTVVGVAIKGYEKSVVGISDWKDIVAIAAGYSQTMGLKKDGTVVAVENAAEAGAWKDIVGISTGHASIGLKKDGTLVGIGNNWRGALNFAEWKDIVQVASGDDQTYGRRKDGTVRVCGYTNLMEKWKFVVDTSGMTDVVDIKAFSWEIIGLRKDGTVVVAGENNCGQQAMNEAGVKDAVAVTSGEHFFAALRPDGTIHCVGQFAKTMNAMGWNLGPTPPDAYQVRNRTEAGD
jgi:alpha-tubulin suppressor-like RCC1 family protein